jgi:uncharacterized protein (TIGR02246 family)
MNGHRALRARRTRCSLLAAVSVLASACAHWPGGRAPAADVRAAIGAANAEYARALVAGDARAMAAVFAEDGQVVAATHPGFVSGRTEIEAYNARRLEGRRYLDAVITTVDVGVEGDLAWETGTSRVTVQHGKTAPVTLTGRYLAVWERGSDRRWRIRVEIPVPDPAP